MNHNEKLEKANLLQKKIELRENLPHLYGFKLYSWARKFHDSRNHMNLLCAANQISKSSTMIRRFINRATTPEIWKELWPTRPLQFWYLYPSIKVATTEFYEKWEPEFLPRGKYKTDHPIYGWEADTKNKEIQAIHFRAGVSIYFKSYTQDLQNLQTGTVHELGCDEELPWELYPELQFRLAATNGYFNMVFTATLGQEEWREAMEEKGPRERFKDAMKQTISMYDCLQYEDGTQSMWTVEKIQKIINSCATQKEVDRRVFGKFVQTEGLRFEAFAKKENVIKPHPIPPTWKNYCGVDIGSGGQSGHPSAITFIAVRPDYRYGIVFKGWRGDGVSTTASDVVEKYIQMKGGMILTSSVYDYASRDFFAIATRMNQPFKRADKSNDAGEQILNTLFRNKMLAFFDIPELQPHINEFASLRVDIDKRDRKDDAADSTRYAVIEIPWDYSAITADHLLFKSQKVKSEVEERREIFMKADDNLDLMVNEEIEAWNELYEV